MGGKRRGAMGDDFLAGFAVTYWCAFTGCQHLPQFVVVGPFMPPGEAQEGPLLAAQCWVCPEHVSAARAYFVEPETLSLGDVRRSDVPWVLRELFGGDVPEAQPIDVPALVGLG